VARSDVDTKIRLRGIDAAELHTRCADELARAQAARIALQAMLADGGVTISRVGNSTIRRRCSMAALRALTMEASAGLGAVSRRYWITTTRVPIITRL
jgi:hypothetical protein